MKVLMREQDLSDEYLRFARQIGADGLDIHSSKNVPGFAEQGYPDLEDLRALKSRLSAANLGVYRVAPPHPGRYLRGQADGDEDVENLVKTLQAFGQVGIPMMSMPIHLASPGHKGSYSHVHRGGYKMHAFSAGEMDVRPKGDTYADGVTAEDHWNRCVDLYGRLVPIAENCNVKLITHPSDPPMPYASVSPRRWAGRPWQWCSGGAAALVLAEVRECRVVKTDLENQIGSILEVRLAKCILAGEIIRRQ